MNASALIAANISAHTVDGYTAQHMVALAHERTIRNMAAEIVRLNGDGLTPKRGRYLGRVTLLEAACLVEFEYDDDAGMTFTGAYINGVMCSVAKMPDEILEQWEAELRRDGAEARALDRLAA
jgi:hypothetical protein